MEGKKLYIYGGKKTKENSEEKTGSKSQHLLFEEINFESVLFDTSTRSFFFFFFKKVIFLHTFHSPSYKECSTSVTPA